MSRSIVSSILFASTALAMNCDLSGYKAQPGIAAAMQEGSLVLRWMGENAQELRAIFDISNGRPVIMELAVRRSGGAWRALARGMTPHFDVTAGVRRISNQQLAPMKQLNIATPERIEQEKWNVFWDSPLTIPGAARTNPGLPRSPDEIRRANVLYKSTGCSVKTDGLRVEVEFPGLSLGIFNGSLRFTIYKGTNLLRQEAIAKTEEQSVAYKYSAGLTGLKLDTAQRVIWRDTARAWQKYEFGGALNRDPVALRARNRLAIVETAGGSIAVFPPPHKFFFAREIELNLGYVWYRKDDPNSFSVGVRHGDREEGYRPYGKSQELWDKRQKQARGFAEGNFALYNAPPGTWQRMAAYYYLSPNNGVKTQESVMALTHDDTFKAIPGYKVAVSHFHTHFHELLLDQGSLDVQPQWWPVFRALGINIAMMSDFHGDGHAEDHGPLRFRDQQAYFDGCKRHSDSDFLLMPGEEPDAKFGGHYTTVFPKPVYWSHEREASQQFEEQDPKYGKVYHIGSPAEELEMLKREGGLMWQAHPRTKGSTGFPDAVRDQAHFLSDRFLGGSYQSLPVDQSESRICEKRCFGTLDDMNNWGAPKYMLAEGDTYQKFPEDDTFSHLIVNYIKLDRLPRFDEDWSPILKALRAGDYFVSTGEVLIRSSAVNGTGAQRTMTAEVEWTFPPEFVELVWGDGSKTDRQIVKATDKSPHSTTKFTIPFDASGKKWVRFAAWDSAGNGAFSQPVHLK